MEYQDTNMSRIDKDYRYPVYGNNCDTHLGAFKEAAQQYDNFSTST